ncbi:TIGR00180 family glycosyltransferase [Clostridium cylindrosporum]|uniref:Uncharacterized protein n=1 Tax=Clostridium cylindrosporum DSM 605 TaxID=1121307 RepID=A0A0J8DEM7_CLOCY|nr:TIGR00180 family glycosyltransferase [Clostridium cylindrosporum]KMT22638.1 hypothetical protein CLCY_9c00690 [Clostridium cylindrosporum DSM 605]
MDKKIESLKKRVSESVQFLIADNKLDEAISLINGYFKINSGDIEIYSMKAVVLIMQGDLEAAEEIINDGLKIDDNNFDLLYNLAYVYEQKEEYSKAIIYYKRARKLKYYESTMKHEIDKIIENILINNRERIEEECKTNEIYRYLNKVNNVLFIDFNLTKKVNDLGKSLDEYGINIDLAYSGTSPDSNFSNKELIYRKTLGITNVDDLIEYVNYYCYDIVHIFNATQDINKYLKEKCDVQVISNDDFLMNKIEVILKSYSESIKHKKYKLNNENGEDLTILIPTYNRPEVFKRTLSFFNSFKNCKPYIIVLDSSSDVNKKVNESTVLNYNNKKISYYAFDDSIECDFKINFGFEIIKTPYTAICADDDILTEEGIIKSLELLKEDNSLFSVKGKNLYFSGEISKLKEYDFFEGLMQENLVDRMHSYVKGFVCTLTYQVFRTYQIKKIYSFIKSNFDKVPIDGVFAEYCFYFLEVITGKIRKMNIDLNIRDKGIQREYYVKNFPETVVEGSFNKNYSMLCDFLCNYCEEIGANSNALKQNMDNIFSDFLINFISVPKEYIIIKDNKFDLVQLEIGMRKSWVWPRNL